MGGMIAQIYASSHLSKRLNGLILMSTTPKFHNTVMDQYREDLLSAKEEVLIVNEDVIDMFIKAIFHRRFLKANPDFMKKFRKKTFQIENFVGFRTLQEIYRFNSLSNIKNISVPTLILTSDKDMLIMPQDSEILKNHIPNSKLVTLTPKIGHYIHFEAQEDYSKAVKNFIKTL